MTGERFTVKLRQGATIYSITDYYGELPLSEGMYYKSNADKLCEWLNTQHELLNAFCKENEELKQAYTQLKHRHSLLHDVCIDVECDRDSYRKDIASLEKENEQLKQEVTHWKKILDDYQQIVAKTLREQYHWLKNEDKILNHDKTVALLELESISERLGVELK